MTHQFNLDHEFVHKTGSHEVCIKWTRLGPEAAPALIFIHGTPWSNVVWHDLAASLASRYSIYLYDHPGFGASPAPRRLIEADDQENVDLDASLSLRAEASAALIRHWNLSTPPHVVAHDNAGVVSLRLLLEHQITFKSLCLVDVVTFSSAGLPFFKLVAENKDVFEAMPPLFIEGLARAYVKSATHKPMPSEIENMLCAPWLPDGTQGPKAFLREMIQAYHRNVGALENSYNRVGGLTPTKIIWGQDDTWLPTSLGEKLKEAINAEQLVPVPEAGHLIHYDQPAKLALEVGLWLSQNS